MINGPITAPRPASSIPAIIISYRDSFFSFFASLLYWVWLLKFFIMGMPGTGKSTMIRNIIDFLKDKGKKVGGIFCPEIREEGVRVGFEIIDLLTGRRGILSHVRLSSGPSIGRYRVNLQGISQIGVTALYNAIQKADVIIIDEIGPMELQGEDFQKAVIRTLEASKPILGIIHWKITHPIVNRIKERIDVEIFEVTTKNRDRVQITIREKMLNALGVFE
jgi:nucleoside-triphosphatase